MKLVKRKSLITVSTTLNSAAFLLLIVFAGFAQTQNVSKSPSEEFVSSDGLTVEKLIELGISRRADLQAVKQNLTIAEGKLQQARFRPNPTFNSEYSTGRFFGDTENALSVGVSQVFETGNKRSRRSAVAELELNQVRADVSSIERAIAVEIRSAYSNTISAVRQLDMLEKLIAADLEIVRITEERLKEGDVAPLEVNLVKVEADRLKIQAIQTKVEVETSLLRLKTLIGADISESLKLAPQSDRPPRLDIGVSELTEKALNARSDLQAARIGEEIGTAKVSLARSNAIPNIEGSVSYSRNKRVTEFPSAIGGSVASRDNELTFGVAIELPFFNRNQGEIASASGEKLQATREREFLESEIKRDVAVAYRNYRAASESLVIYSTQIIPRAEENLKSVRAAYGFGEFSIFEVVNEQRRLTENITGYNQALQNYYNALTQLEIAIGINLPKEGFSSDSNSVLPNRDLVPVQIDRATFMKSIELPNSKQKTEISKNKLVQEEEIK